ncbi:MAG: hypothetical protein V4450_02080 [Bacteroidota bacterium]
MKQVTFKIADVLKLVGDQKTGNVLVNVHDNPKRPTATLVPSAPPPTGTALKTTATAGADPITIEGCPYPPGCTEEEAG